MWCFAVFCSFYEFCGCFSKNSVLRYFCGVLWCFAVFCVRVFSVFFLTAQNRPKNIQNEQNEQNTKYALCNTAQYSAVRLSLTQKMSTKKIQNTSKTLQNIRKTLQNTVFQKTLAKHHKSPAKHRKTPQNTFANKTDRIS